MKIKLVQETLTHQDQENLRIIEEVKRELEEKKKQPKTVQEYFFPEIKLWQL